MADKKEKRYTFNTKLYEVCADDELRPLMQCVHFVNGFAYASNGYISIKQTLELQSCINKELLDDKSMHRNSYRAIMAFEIAECTADGIYCKNTTGETAFFDYFDRKGDPIPNFEKAMAAHRGLTSLTFIGIDPELLNKLVKAIYNPSNQLRMQFTGIDSNIIIDAVGVDDQVAHLMPKIINATLF